MLDLFASDVSFDELADGGTDDADGGGTARKVAVNPELEELATAEARYNQRAGWGAGGRRGRNSGSRRPPMPLTRIRASRPQIIQS